MLVVIHMLSLCFAPSEIKQVMQLFYNAIIYIDLYNIIVYIRNNPYRYKRIGREAALPCYLNLRGACTPLISCYAICAHSALGLLFVIVIVIFIFIFYSRGIQQNGLYFGLFREFYGISFFNLKTKNNTSEYQIRKKTDSFFRNFSMSAVAKEKLSNNNGLFSVPCS